MPLRRLALLSLVLAASACGDVLTPDGTPPRTLFEVGGETRGALGEDVDGELRAALAWSVTSADLLACLDEVPVDGPLDFADPGDEAIARGLQACLLFSERGHVETASVPLQAELTSFSIPVAALPDPSLLSGTADALLGIADLLVYTDDDATGAFEETPRGAAAFRDVVRGTSYPFRDDDADVDFVVYREGALSPLWKLYEALYGCPEPPPGPSTAHVELFDDGGVVCTLDDGPVVVELADEPRVASLGCAADPLRHQMLRPADVDGDALPPGAAAVCEAVDGYYDLYVTETPGSVCPSFRLYALVGCSDLTSEEACFDTYWDDLGDEPAWWPCKFDDGTTPRLFVEEPQLATDDLDVLFEVNWYDGFGGVPQDELALVFTMDDAGTTYTWPAAGLELVDADGDGVFEVGDRLVVREVEDVFGPSTPFGNYPFTVGPLQGWYAPVAPPPAPDHQLVCVDAEAPITDGIDDVVRVRYPAGAGDVYPLAGLTIRVYVGGELPWSASVAGGGVVLSDDVDGDGAFGPGDELLMREETGDFGAPLTPETLQSFTGQLYVQVDVDIGFNAHGAMGYGSVLVE